MPVTTKTGCQGSKDYVYGGYTDSKGRVVQTETSDVGGVLQNVSKVTNDKTGKSDIYIDKTWGTKK